MAFDSRNRGYVRWLPSLLMNKQALVQELSAGVFSSSVTGRDSEIGVDIIAAVRGGKNRVHGQ